MRKRNLPESRRHAPVNSVFRNTTASMRSATARERTRHTARSALAPGNGIKRSTTIRTHRPRRQTRPHRRTSHPTAPGLSPTQLPAHPDSSTPVTPRPAPAPAPPAAAPSPGGPTTTARRPSAPARRTSAAHSASAAARTYASGWVTPWSAREPRLRRPAGRRSGLGGPRGRRGRGRRRLPACLLLPCAVPVLAIGGDTAPTAPPGHRRSPVWRLTTPLPRGMRRLRAPSPAVLADAHAAGGSGDGHDRGGQTDGYVQGAHGKPPPRRGKESTCPTPAARKRTRG